MPARPPVLLAPEIQAAPAHALEALCCYFCQQSPRPGPSPWVLLHGPDARAKPRVLRCPAVLLLSQLRRRICNILLEVRVACPYSFPCREVSTNTGWAGSTCHECSSHLKGLCRARERAPVESAARYLHHSHALQNLLARGKQKCLVQAATV
jgi:hypothetical protein